MCVCVFALAFTRSAHGPPVDRRQCGQRVNPRIPHVYRGSSKCPGAVGTCPSSVPSSVSHGPPRLPASFVGDGNAKSPAPVAANLCRAIKSRTSHFAAKRISAVWQEPRRIYVHLRRAASPYARVIFARSRIIRHVRYNRPPKDTPSARPTASAHILTTTLH